MWSIFDELLAEELQDVFDLSLPEESSTSIEQRQCQIQQLVMMEIAKGAPFLWKMIPNPKQVFKEIKQGEMDTE